MREIKADDLRRERDQLWAETVARFQEGEHWWFESPELNALANKEQRKRFAHGQWDAVIEKYLSDSTADQITIEEIRTDVINKPLAQWTQIDMNSVARCLRHFGWTKKRIRVAQGLKWVYTRPIEQLGEEEDEENPDK